MTVAVAVDVPDTLPVATLDDIVGATDTRTESIPVPEWGASVIVRGFTRQQALQWSKCEDEVESEALCLHFGLAEPEVTLEQARDLVQTKSSRALAKVLVGVMRLSGLGVAFRDERAEG